MERTAVYFNGGKESLIILHMFGTTSQIVWVPDSNDFPEVTKYVLEMTQNLKVWKYSDFQTSLKDLEGRGITTVITGVRRTDPGCQAMTTYQKIDSNWANTSIIRYSPLLDWSYSDVWKYIEDYKLPVCPLYEHGYTSLGNRLNTWPNAHLFDGTGYRHARELIQTDTERMGRLTTKLPITFTGPVVKGAQRGRTLGCPTANFSNFEGSVHLEEGVYYGYVWFRNQKYRMVLSYGENYQFNTRSLEVHIDEKFEEEFYGALLEVQIVGFIRRMTRYENLDELRTAIQKDVTIMRWHLKEI